MTESEAQIIRLLTEIRDEGRAHREAGDRAVDESLSLQRRGVRGQRIALIVLFLVMLAAAAVLLLVSSRGR